MDEEEVPVEVVVVLVVDETLRELPPMTDETTDVNVCVTFVALLTPESNNTLGASPKKGVSNAMHPRT